MLLYLKSKCILIALTYFFMLKSHSLWCPQEVCTVETMTAENSNNKCLHKENAPSVTPLGNLENVTIYQNHNYNHKPLSLKKVRNQNKMKKKKKSLHGPAETAEILVSSIPLTCVCTTKPENRGEMEKYHLLLFMVQFKGWGEEGKIS